MTARVRPGVFFDPPADLPRGRHQLSRQQVQDAQRVRLMVAFTELLADRGYAGVRIGDIASRATVSSQSFYELFASKEACAVAAAAHFAANADALFDAAPYTRLHDPRDRVLGYIDFRKAILQGELPQFTCLLGTMVQEAYDTHPAIRAACDRYISEHAQRLEADIAEAKALYAPEADWTPENAALFSQAVLQGGFVLAKAKHGPKVAADCLDHLKRYFEALLGSRAPRSEGKRVQ